jgi:two-component system response regulator FixJ
MKKTEPTVFVVDDDEAIRKALRLLMKSAGLAVETFASAAEFLQAYDEDRSGCLVLDIRMSGMSGIELQKKLASMNSLLPIIFVTGHGDVPLAVQAMRDGAVDFIEKPYSDQRLLDRIHQAIDQDGKNRKDLAQRKAIEERLALLTPRERQVMEKVVSGRPNKVIAYELEISERTVEIHRSRLMAKMKATSLAHLVRMGMKVRE